MWLPEVQLPFPPIGHYFINSNVVILTLLAEMKLPLLVLGYRAGKRVWVVEVVRPLLTTDQGFISSNEVA